MTTLPIGTTKTIFGNTFIYVDPQYISNLGLWRQYMGIPETDDPKSGLGGILPIVVTDLDNSVVNIKFDIKDLPSIRVSPGNKSFLSPASTLLQTDSQSLPDFLPAGAVVKTIAPVQNFAAENKTVLFFNIGSLDRAEIKGHGTGFVDTSSEKYRVTLKDYNKSNGVTIDSEAPMVDEVIGNTATFSFDITTLPKV